MKKLLAKLKAFLNQFSEDKSPSPSAPALPTQPPIAGAAPHTPTPAPSPQPPVPSGTTQVISTTVGPNNQWFDLSVSPVLDEYGLWRPSWLADVVREIESTPALASRFAGTQNALPLALFVIEALPFATTQAQRLNIDGAVQFASMGGIAHAGTGGDANGVFSGPCGTYEMRPHPVTGIPTRQGPLVPLPRSAALMVDTVRQVSLATSESDFRARFRRYYNLPS